MSASSSGMASDMSPTGRILLLSVANCNKTPFELLRKVQLRAVHKIQIHVRICKNNIEIYIHNMLAKRETLSL